MDLRHARLNGQRRAISGNRLVQSARVAQGLAQVGMEHRLAPVAANGPADQFDGHLELPGLHGQQAQQVQRLRIVGLGSQHLAIDPLGFGQLAGLMVASALRQCFRDVQHIRFIVVS